MSELLVARYRVGRYASLTWWYKMGQFGNATKVLIAMQAGGAREKCVLRNCEIEHIGGIIVSISL